MGTRTVALSMPPNKWSTSTLARDTEYCERWHGVNHSLCTWAEEPGTQSGVGLLVDTSQLVPFSEAALWEEDGLHMSPSGSERLGTGLAPLLTNLWQRDVVKTVTQ